MLHIMCDHCQQIIFSEYSDLSHSSLKPSHSDQGFYIDVQGYSMWWQLRDPFLQIAVVLFPMPFSEIVVPSGRIYSFEMPLQGLSIS